MMTLLVSESVPYHFLVIPHLMRNLL